MAFKTFKTVFKSGYSQISIDGLTSYTGSFTGTFKGTFDGISGSVNGTGSDSISSSYALTASYIDLSNIMKTKHHQEFTENGTWTKPANVDYVEVWLIGGGGSGGTGVNGFNPGYGGGGGGAGQVVHAIKKVISDISVTIGDHDEDSTLTGGCSLIAKAGGVGANAIYGGHYGGSNYSAVNPDLSGESGGGGNGGGMSQAGGEGAKLPITVTINLGSAGNIYLGGTGGVTINGYAGGAGGAAGYGGAGGNGGTGSYSGQSGYPGNGYGAGGGGGSGRLDGVGIKGGDGFKGFCEIWWEE